MSTKTTSFDIAEHLNSSEEIRIFLKEVAATGDESDFIHALAAISPEHARIPAWRVLHT